MTAVAAQGGAPGPLARVRWAVTDTLTITRRNLLVWMRVPSYIVFTVIQPVMFVCCSASSSAALSRYRARSAMSTS